LQLTLGIAAPKMDANTARHRLTMVLAGSNSAAFAASLANNAINTGCEDTVQKRNISPRD
jgi:hypothetical protein